MENNYRQIFDPFINDVEGYSNESYQDTKGNPTIGHGINLNDEENQGLFKTYGFEPEKLKSGEQTLDEDSAKNIKDSIVRRKEQLVKDKLGPDLFESLKPHEKAAVMSMGYNSMNLLGPNMTKSIADQDVINTLREIMLNSNPKAEPGVQARRLREAELYGDPIGFSQTFQTLSPEEKQSITDILNKTQNEGHKQELLQKYGSYLGENRTPNLVFPKLNKLLRMSNK